MVLLISGALCKSDQEVLHCTVTFGCSRKLSNIIRFFHLNQVSHPHIRKKEKSVCVCPQQHFTLEICWRWLLRFSGGSLSLSLSLLLAWEPLLSSTLSLGGTQTLLASECCGDLEFDACSKCSRNSRARHWCPPICGTRPLGIWRYVARVPD